MWHVWRISPEVALLSPSHLNPHNPPVITAHHSPHSMTRYLLSICYVPGTGLGSGATVDEQMAGSLRSWRLYLPLGLSLCSCVSVLRLCWCQGQCILLRPLGPHTAKEPLKRSCCWRVRHPCHRVICVLPLNPPRRTVVAHSAFHTASLLSVLPASRVGRNGWQGDLESPCSNESGCSS